MKFLRITIWLLANVVFYVSSFEKILDIKTFYSNKSVTYRNNQYQKPTIRLQRRHIKKSSNYESTNSAIDYISDYFLQPVKSFWNIADDEENLEYDPNKLKSLPKASPELVKEIHYYIPFTGASYCDSVTKSKCKYCNKIKSDVNQIIDEKTNTVAIIVYNKENDEIVVAYKGCENIFKFIEAAAVVKTNFIGIPGAFVHKNHMTYVNNIRFKLRCKIIKLIKAYPIKRIVLLGHSLGGSLATLSAPLLSQDLNVSPKKIRVITYGQPRSGNEMFARWYNHQKFNFTRVVNFDDPIVSHPPAREGWTHVNTEVFIADNQFYSCNTTRFEHRDCSFGKATWRGLFYSHRYIGDNFISRRACY